MVLYNILYVTVTNHGASNNVIINEHSDVTELSDSNKESNESNGNKGSNEDDDDDDDDDELFCDSLGPELMEEQVLIVISTPLDFGLNNIFLCLQAEITNVRMCLLKLPHILDFEN